MTLGERIKTIRKSMQPKMSQEKFAETLGTTRPALAVYEIDRVVPNDAFINLICLKFKVNERWLRTGEGEMFTAPKDDPMDEVASRYQLTPDERIIVETYLQFPPEGRQKIMDFITQCASQLNKLKEAGIPMSSVNVSNLLDSTFKPTVTVNELDNAIDELTRIRNHKLEQQSSVSQPTESENFTKVKIKAQKS